jgi:hypothetical protein
MAIKTRSQLKAYFITGAQPTASQFDDLLDTTFLAGDSVPVGNITYGIQTLTDSATITWNMAGGTNATVTLGGNRTLSVSNMSAGQFATLIIKQDATGSRSLTLPSGSKVVNSGAGAVILSTTANAIDILTCFYDGANYYWLLNKKFT